MKDEPIAFFLTIATYGTWLPGDQRGWVEYQRGWRMPDPVRELEAAARMSGTPTILTPRARELVATQVRETCSYRGWICHAVNCRSNHMHAVITALNTTPKKVRADLKAWCTRRLKQQSQAPCADQWWAERGSIRWIFDEVALERVVLYTTDAQE